MSFIFEAIYIINLDKDVKRWKQVMQQIKQFNKPVTRVPAVDASKLDKKTIENITSDICAKFCTKTMIACAASHIKAWKTFLQTSLSHILICEDDVEFASNSHQLLPNMMKQIPKDFDLVWIGCNDCQYHKNEYAWSSNGLHFLLRLTSNLPKENKIISNNVYIPKIALGTHCYMLSRKGAEQLLKHVDKISFHIDTTLSTLIPHLKMYALHPKLATQKCLLYSSTIATGKYPQFLNSYADSIVNKDGTSLAYILSLPVGQIGHFKINGWSFFAILLGVIYSSNLINPNYKQLLLYVLVLVFIVADLFYSINVQTLFDMFSFVCTFLITVIGFSGIKSIQF